MVAQNTEKKRPNITVLMVILIVAIVIVFFALVGTLMRGNSSSSSTSTPTTQVSANAVDSQGRITLSGCYDIDGPTLSKLLKDNGYSYSSSDGFWTKQSSSYLYEFALFDEDGDLISQTTLENVKGQVDDTYEIGLYSRTARNNAYGLDDHNVNVTKSKTLEGANQEATIAIVKGGSENHLVIVNLDMYDAYEYEVYSASETMIKNRGVDGLSAHSLNSAYDETVSNYR